MRGIITVVLRITIDLNQPTSVETALTTAVEIINAGGLVIFPTETTYGAGVDATNPAAVDKLLAYKARREGKPLSIAVPNQTMAEKYVVLTESARRLYTRFLPGPVTVVSQGRGVVAPGVESEFSTLGVRIPDYPFILELLTRLNKPLTATSANMSNGKRPYNIDELLMQLPSKQQSLIDLILDVGTLPPNPPSTVIDTTLSTPVVFREGEIKLDASDQGVGAAPPRVSGVKQDHAVQTFTSHSEAETQGLAGRLLLKYWNPLKETGLIIALDGSLGAGKTVFTKGLAEFLQITEPVTSPTYTYLEEYDFNRHGVTGQLCHFDLWRVNSADELAALAIDTLVKPNNLLVIEWFDQVKTWLPTFTAPVLHIKIADHNPERVITVQEPTT